MKNGKAQKKFPGATSYLDRHGKRRWRYRRGGNSVELGANFGSENFRERYERAIAGGKAQGGKTQSRYSFSNLAKAYRKTAEFINTSPSTQSKRSRIIGNFLAEHGSKSAKTIRPRHIRKILEAKRETPAAANDLRLLLEAMLDLSLDLEWRDDNPVSGIKPFPATRRTIHTWTEDEIEKYLECYPPGCAAHTAMILMLYTGAARVDAVRLGPKNLVNGRLKYFRQKTKNSGGVEIDIPLHPELSACLKPFIEDDVQTFLQLSNGKQRSEKGLGMSFRIWCDRAGLSECTPHGLRKAIARRLAVAGCSPHEIMAVTGHRDLEMVALYASEARREGLANQAIDLLS